MKRIFFLILTLILALIPALTNAQIMFQRHYGGSGNESGVNCLQTSAGGYIATGTTDSYGAGGYDVYIVKTNEYGDTTWTKTYGGSGYDVSTEIVETYDDGYAISGITNSVGAGDHDCFLLRINQSGDTIWTRTYGKSGSDDCYSLIQCADSGLLIVGSTPNIISGYWDVYCIKTDFFGDTVWTRTFSEKNFNAGFSAVQTMDGGYLIVAITSTYGVSNTKDGFIIKLNEFGDSIWTKTIDKGMDDWVSCVVELSNGDFVVSGTTNSMGYGGYDIYLARYNSNGDEIWFMNYGGTEDDLGGKIIVTNDSGVVLSGSSFSFGLGGSDAYVLKTNLHGDTLWTKTFGGIENDNGGSIMQTTDGGLIIGGSSSSYGNGSEMFLIKTNSNGFAGIDQLLNASNEVQIFPNPNNGVFAIERKSLDASSSALRIFDINGKLVYSLPHIFQNSMTENIEVPDLGSGVYFLTISDEYQNAATKLTIIK